MYNSVGIVILYLLTYLPFGAIIRRPLPISIRLISKPFSHGWLAFSAMYKNSLFAFLDTCKERHLKKSKHLPHEAPIKTNESHVIPCLSQGILIKELTFKQELSALELRKKMPSSKVLRSII